MNTKSALVVIITMILMATPLTLLTPEAGAEKWTQTSDHQFSGGAMDDVVVGGTAEDAYLELDTAGSGGEFARTDDGPDAGLYGAAAVWDSKRNQVVLFGGNAGGYKNGTWIYDPATDIYTGSSSAINPPARSRAAMVYDAACDKVVLFGGRGSTPAYKSDTWIYDPATDSWLQVYPASHPSARDGPAMTYDTANEVVVLFGGYADGYSDETWTYSVSSNTWTQKYPTTKPSARTTHAMAYDSANSVSVLFGGNDGGYDDETWTYDAGTNTWANKDPSGDSPSGRTYQTMAYDSANGVSVLFGGYDSSGYDDETWVYSVSSNTWTQKSPSSRPVSRSRHVMIYDDSRGKVLTLGGYSSRTTQHANFYRENVASSGSTGAWSDLVLDDDGHSHISYVCTAFPDNSMLYAEWSGSSWSTTTVDSTAQYGPTAIVLDLEGYPHILYRDDDGDLMHGYKDSGEWHTETVNSTHDDTVGYGVDLAIDRFGYMHASYHYQSESDLYYIKKTDSWGSPQSLDTSGSTGYRPSIAVDRDGNPHIAYGYSSGGSLKYIASGDGGSTWGSAEVVDSSLYGAAQVHCSLALDPAGTPYISYNDDDNKLGFAYKHGSTWGTENPVSTTYYGYYTSLALDRNGRPHITSFYKTGDDVMYTWLDRNGDWRTTSVDFDALSSSNFRGTACAIDDQGRLHVSYHGSDFDLGYAEQLLLNWEYDLPDNEWAPMGETRDGPSDRQLHKMVYDSSVKKIVLFGGYDSDSTLDGSTMNNETWTFDPATRVWQRQFPSSKPSARDKHAMAYDFVNGVTVLFGGYSGSSNDETWTYDAGANTWTQKSPFSKPSAREDHAMAYDSANGVTVLFGGDDGTRDNETWTYDVATDAWTQKSPSSKPSARQDHAMAYDSANGVTVLFGGNDGTYDDETWTYDVTTDTWTQKSLSSKPSAREDHAMTYDSANGVTVLVGGYDATYDDDETWTYDVTTDTWTQKSLSSKPSARSAHAMAYDSDHEAIILFGGYTGSNQLDTYQLHLTNYETAGSYTSEAYSVHADRGVKWGTIHWNARIPNGADVEFQVAVSNDGKSWDFVGPDGTSATFYNDVTGNVLYSGHYGKIVRYKAFLRAAPSGDTSEIHDVTVTWREMVVPTVTLNWPNGGENLMHGESYAVTWTATGDLRSSDPVALSYSLDSGSSWTDITTGTDNDGTYLWTLPSNENVERALVKIVVTALDGSSYQDTSDMTFSIDPPPVNPETGDRVISPAPGDELLAGETARIEWLLAEEGAVSLSYSTDFGQSWQPIVSDILNLGVYNWVVPSDMTSENVVLKVQGQGEPLHSGVFTVGDKSGMEGQETDERKDPSSADNLLGSLTALLIICFVVLVLVVREKPEQRTSARSNSQHPNTSKEEKK